MPDFERLLLGDGRPALVAVIARSSDGFAFVNECPVHPGYFNITYKPTSHRLPYHFPSSVAAEVALVELDEILGWEQFVLTLASGNRPNAMDQVMEICVSNGGHPIYELNEVLRAMSRDRIIAYRRNQTET